MVQAYQTTFYYFTEDHSDWEKPNGGCTILSQAFFLKLKFTESGHVDFETPRCVHCWSKNVKKDGTIVKSILKTNSKDNRYDCQHYVCLNCGRPSSPILTNAFVYDTYTEGLRRLDNVNAALEKWESEGMNEQDLAGKIYQAVQEIYSMNLNFPRGKNVIYSKSELTDIMIRNIIDCQCSEMSSNLLNLPGQGKKAPDADTLLIYLGRNSEGDIRKNIKEIFDVVNQKAQSIGFYDEPLPVAIDFYLEPYYGKQRQKTVRTSKKKSHAGTQYNFKYATADIAAAGSRLTVFGQHMSQLDRKVDIFKEVVEYTLKKLSIEYLMADREFFTVEIIKYLENNIPYIIPAVKNEAILKLAKENYHKGNYVFNHMFGGKKDGIEIIIFAIANKDFDITKEISKHNPEFFVFATNMPINKADINSESVKHSDPKRHTGHLRSELAEMYTARWGIETDYRVYAHEFRPRTTSNKFQIRYPMFFSGEIMRDIWILTQFLLKNLLEKVLPKKILRAKIFKELLRKGIWQDSVLKNISILRQQIVMIQKNLALFNTQMPFQ